MTWTLDDVVIVTLSRNNPIELRRTLASIYLQAMPLTVHVLDGSDSPQEAAQMTQHFGYEYSWFPPRGIYPAMQTALERIQTHKLVWFLNSSDWLINPSVLNRLSGFLDSLDSTPTWLIGGLKTLHRGKFLASYSLQSKNETFHSRLLRGKIGIPHPSALISAKALRSIGGFATAHDLAADYALGLDLLKNFGPPTVVGFPFSIHELGGSTERGKEVYFSQKLDIRRSRLGMGPIDSILDSLRLFVYGAGRYAKSRVEGRIRPLRETKQNGSLLHYCDSDNSSAWPVCCREFLGNYGE